MKLRKGHSLTWKTESGEQQTGIVLVTDHTPGTVLAGYQPPEAPYTSVRLWDKNLQKYINRTVPNNSLVVVPFSSIVSTGIPSVSRETTNQEPTHSPGL